MSPSGDKAKVSTQLHLKVYDRVYYCIYVVVDKGAKTKRLTHLAQAGSRSSLGDLSRLVRSTAALQLEAQVREYKQSKTDNLQNGGGIEANLLQESNVKWRPALGW